jgi:hypothetical protein
MGLGQIHKQEFMKLTCITKQKRRLMQVGSKWCNGFNKANIKLKLYTTFGRRPHSFPYIIFYDSMW